MFHSLPFKTEPESNIIRCFCSNCTNNNECTTDGSCFVQHNVKDKRAGFVQTCIDKGSHRDSICNSVAGTSTNAPDARCCEKDFCNGKRQVITTMATTGKRTYTVTTFTEVAGLVIYCILSNWKPLESEMVDDLKKEKGKGTITLPYCCKHVKIRMITHFFHIILLVCVFILPETHNL